MTITKTLPHPMVGDPALATSVVDVALPPVVLHLVRTLVALPLLILPTPPSHPRSISPRANHRAANLILPTRAKVHSLKLLSVPPLPPNSNTNKSLPHHLPSTREARTATTRASSTTSRTSIRLECTTRNI
jgi:hypothetical protein